MVRHIVLSSGVRKLFFANPKHFYLRRLGKKMKAYRPHQDHGNKEAGFTLIEVIVSISILAIGLLAMANMHVMAIHTNAKARRITESTAQAQAVLEEFMKIPLDSPLMVSVSDPDSPLIPDSMKRRGYDVTWGVSQPNANSRLITVTVAWKEMGFMTKRTRLSYLTVSGAADAR